MFYLCALGIKLFGLMVLPLPEQCVLRVYLSGGPHSFRWRTRAMGSGIAQRAHIRSQRQRGENHRERPRTIASARSSFTRKKNNIHNILNYVCEEKCVRLSVEYGPMVEATPPIPHSDSIPHRHCRVRANQWISVFQSRNGRPFRRVRSPTVYISLNN